jgi:uncharacterized protein
MRTLRRALIAVALLAIVIYAAGAAWLMSQETRLLFNAGAPLPQARPVPPFEQVTVPAASDNPLQAVRAAVESHGGGGRPPFAWVMQNAQQPSTKPWIIFLHGNTATVASRVNIYHYDQLRKLGFNVLAPEYHGFGGMEGTPSEAAIDGDARAAYQLARVQLRVPPRRIIIYGWSLGSAVAVDLASRVEAAAVILEGAPSSIVAVGQARYPYFPVRLLMRNPFDSIAKIQRVHAPVLFLHSAGDEIVPIEEGRRLFEAANEPKRFVTVHGGHVYASERDPGFFPAVRAFLAQYGLCPSQ